MKIVGVQVTTASPPDLMGRFYRNLKAWRGKLDALRGAQLEMMRLSRAHPFYWASFVLVGDPD